MSTVTIALPRRGSALRFAQRYGVYGALVLIFGYNLVFTANFFTLANFRTQFVQVIPVLIVALGMALVIGTEGIDLSVGASMAMAAAVLPLYLGYGFFPAAIVALVAVAMIGVINGTLVAAVGVQPIVATLALMVAGRGLALVVSGDQSKTVLDPVLLELSRGSIGGVLPYTVLLGAVLVGIIAVLVNLTTFGKQLVAIGGNRRAAELAGLPVRRILLLVYIVSALLAGIAGLVGVARLSASVPSTLGNLIELSAITAVVVGGTPLAGGRVKIAGTVAGALLLQFISATLIKNNVPDAISQIVQAAIIVVAVFIQRSRQVTR
ncbi:MAG: ABC transporter permease [Micrococcales bacterium]|nr:ABC transporter permease [Micrococcales bacterium]